MLTKAKILLANSVTFLFYLLICTSCFLFNLYMYLRRYVAGRALVWTFYLIQFTSVFVENENVRLKHLLSTFIATINGFTRPEVSYVSWGDLLLNERFSTLVARKPLFTACALLCLLRLPPRLKCFPQSVQARTPCLNWLWENLPRGLSLKCVCLCLFRYLSVLKHFPHSLQTCCFSSWSLPCSIRLLAWVKYFLQTMQTKGFSPAWNLWCASKWLDWVKVCSHSSQENGFSPECVL